MHTGLDAVDAATGEHILCTCALPSGALPALRAYVRAGMALYLQGKLPLLVDGRQSAGPLDLIAFMAQPGVRERVQRALAARRARMLAQGLPVPAKDFEMLAHVLHVSPDGRKAYVGEEWDLTRNGTRIM